MGTSRADISRWFDQGVLTRHQYMLVATDTFDWEDFPVYCKDSEECLRKYRENNNYEGMLKVMEVYDLSEDKTEQLNEERCMRLPKVRGVF